MAARKRQRARQRARRLELRRIVIEAYGGACACCGETIIEFLELDHVNNDGKQDREANGCSYKRARSLGYPPCYQVLCSNCNQAKSRWGICPHAQGAPRYHCFRRRSPTPEPAIWETLGIEPDPEMLNSIDFGLRPYPRGPNPAQKEAS